MTRTQRIIELEAKLQEIDKRLQEYQDWLLKNTSNPNFLLVLDNKRHLTVERNATHTQLINLKLEQPSHGEQIKFMGGDISWHIDQLGNL